MAGNTFSGTVARNITDYLGENLSVLAYGAVGDGVTDDSEAFRLAISRLQSPTDSTANGRRLMIPGGRTYLINSPITFPTGELNIALVGDGLSTVIKRGADMPDGQGVFDLTNVKGVTFKDFVLDGNVTTTTDITYTDLLGSMAYNPLHVNLTKNTSFWIHGPAENITFEGVKITHSGGYAILGDCTTGFITNFRAANNWLSNNRAVTFETNGSWTGGIFFEGNSSYCARSVWVTDNLIERVTGNGFWTHTNSLSLLHENIHADRNTFRDMGRDGILMGAIYGGSASYNKFRRIGYVAADDTSASVPKYPANQYAVGLDTAGITRGVNYIGNSFTSCNGACMDLDGFAEGTVSGNTCIVPRSGETEYTEDNIAAYGGGAGNVTYGLQISNSNNDSIAGSRVTIVGNTFINMRAGAIRLYATRDSFVANNRIEHPADAIVKPIQLGAIGAGGAYQRAYGNVITANVIKYSPASAVAAVLEDSSYAAPSATDVNRVYGNIIDDNGAGVFEFQRAKLSGTESASTGERFYNTNALVWDYTSPGSSVSGISQHSVCREGYAGASTSALAWYIKEGTATKRLNMRLQGFTRTGVQKPLLNVSDNGAANSGVIATGPRTTCDIDDAMATGKLSADSFLMMTNTTFDAAHANIWPDTVGLIRYNSSTKKFEYSNSVASGARVWQDLVGSGGGTAYGSANQIQYAGSSSNFLASSNFTYNPTLSVLTVATTSGIAGILVSGGFIQSAEGFYTASTAYNAVQAPSGGVLGKSLMAYDATPTTGSSSLIVRAGAGQSSALTQWQDNSGNALSLILGDGTFWRMGSGAVKIAMSTNLDIASDTQMRFYDATNIFGASADVGLRRNSAGVLEVNNGTSGTYRDLYTANFKAYGSSANAIEAPNGGVSAVVLVSTRNDGDSGVVLSRTSATARAWGFNVGSDGFLYFRDRTGAANAGYVDLDGRWYLKGLTATAGLTLLAGYLDSAQGYYSANTSYQTVNIPNGGVYSRSGHFAQYIHLGGNAGVPTGTTGSSVPTNGQFYYDTSLNKFRAYENGSWKDMITTVASGVSSVNSLTGALSLVGTVNQVNVNSSGTTITLALPQSISTSSTPTFNGVVSTLAFNANVSGSTIAFQTSSSTFSVDGNGNMSFVGTANGVRNDGSYSYTIERTSSVVRKYGWSINSSGSLILTDVTGAVNRMSVDTSGNFTWGSSVVINQSGALSASGVISSTGASGGVNVTGQTAANSIQTAGGFNAGSLGGANGVYQINGNTVINNSRTFVGAGVDCRFNGIGGLGFNPWNGSSYDTGQTWTINIVDVGGGNYKFRINNGASTADYTYIGFRGGVITTAS
jgi:hypothetical protein